MQSIQTVLAFDCATSPASVALKIGKEVVREWIPHGMQAAALVSTIEKLLMQHGVSISQLDTLVTTIGPGSFTGLRIALATLHGLALAHPIPVRFITSSEAVALNVVGNAHPPEQFYVALDAGKGECFIQLFRTQPLTMPSVSNETEISLHKQSAILELALPCFSNIHPPEHPYYVSGPDAAALARYAENMPVRSLTEAMPYYIRPADAKLPT